LAFVVVYDSSVLYPSTLRDLLIRVAQAGLVQARWTDEILDEVFQSLAQNRPDLDAARLERTRSLMNTGGARLPLRRPADSLISDMATWSSVRGPP